MADRYRTSDGWSVEVVRLACTPDRHDGEWLRIRHLGWYIRDTRSIAELEQYVSLADLEEYALAGRHRFPTMTARWLRMILAVRLPPIPCRPRQPARARPGAEAR